MSSKTVVSFDIGIKNLAYCVFTIYKDEEPATSIAGLPFCASMRPLPKPPVGINVVGWNIINLILQDTVVKPKCNCQKAKGATCGKIATYKYGEEHLYCLTHAKSSGKLLPSKETSTASLKKLKIDELVALCIANKIETAATDKKTAILAKVVAYYATRTLESIVIAKSKNANQIHLVEIGKRIKTQFDEAFAKYEPTHVILENQISPIAGRMNTIQGMVAQYFIMRDRNDKLEIDFISSAGKLKGYITTRVPQTTPIHVSSDMLQNTMDTPVLSNTLVLSDPTPMSSNVAPTTYKDNKRDGIAFCNQFMAANTGLSTFRHIIEAATKKDDLADCFLQGIYFLKRENIINYSEDLKINIV